jgi:hypothetical protein
MPSRNHLRLSPRSFSRGSRAGKHHKNADKWNGVAGGLSKELQRWEWIGKKRKGGIKQKRKRFL